MSCTRYIDKFKLEAVKQATEHGYLDVVQQLGVNSHSLYLWRKKYDDVVSAGHIDDQQAEIKRLRAELKRVTEERDILKKGHRILRQRVSVRYEFTKP